MAINRKLGRPTDQRKALLRGLVTELINNGKIQTTDTRAKEVRSIAEKLITIALRECDNTVEVRKESQNEKGQTININVKNDKASRLHARRQVMAVLYNVKLTRNEDESNKDYKERSAEVNHPVVEKLFSEIAPKYAKRTIEKKQGGGYTRMLKLGPRRGDAAELVILELI